MIFGVPQWSDSAVCKHIARAVRGLSSMGFDASVLLSQTGLDAPAVAAPKGVAIHTLPNTEFDTQSDRWLSQIRYLEENAPCAYVTSQEWIAGLVAPRLSNRIGIIGVLHEDRPEEYDYCRRVGHHWNAVVALDNIVRLRIISASPENASRLASFTNGHSREDETGLAFSYNGLIADIERNAASGRFRRKRKGMARVSAGVVPGLTTAQVAQEVKRVNTVPLWPDSIGKQPRTVRSRGTTSLHDHRIVIAVPTGRVSGADAFSITLARALLKRGYQAELVLTAPDAPIVDKLPLPDDIPAFRLNTKPFPTWPERWAAMKQHLEDRGPAIYVPNYDSRHSCIVPTLSEKVKSVGIAHSDDSQHYTHVLHLAPFWDAVVGVSSAITKTLTELAPGLETRQRTIPNGVPVPSALPERRGSSSPICAVYTGRIVDYQKRVLDLVGVVAALHDRGTAAELTVAGSGVDLERFLEAAKPHIDAGRMNYSGALEFSKIPQLLAANDVFILPSSFEGLPVSLLEAMAHGCVPIVTGIRSGVPEVVRDGENGFIVPVGSIADFAERITRLGADESLLRRMRQNAYKTVRDSHGIDRMTSSYLELFDEIVSDPYVRPQGNIKPPVEMNRIHAVMPDLPMTLRRAVWRLGGN